MEPKKLSRVSVVCTYPFPQGLAATTRIISYLKGLNKEGIDTDVFIYRPTELYNNKSNYPPRGFYQGIQYIYPKTRTYSKYKILRVVKRYYYHLVTCYNIWKENKKKKIDFLLISNDFLNILFLFTFFAKLIKIRPVFITDEYPMPIRVYLKKDIPIWKKILYKLILSYEDSFIFMTNKLNNFFNKELNKPFHILPTITDTSRFEIECPQTPEKKYLCYMGNMELSKDNVDNIIIAFSQIQSQFNDIELYLYGAPNPKDKKFLEQLIQKLNLQNKVFLKGKVPIEEVPCILKNAYILVSSQPDTKRAEGGFPTKLGEYMATGIPTILTDVGEISNYVKDGIHVHIVPPENPTAYADKLRYIISHYTHCCKIAANARQYLFENFDYRTIGKNLKSFLENRL